MRIRRAMLFAAGLGTRLRPLTDHVPKALVQLGGQALLDYNLAHFIAFGCERVVINSHYLAPQIAAHVVQRRRASAPTTAIELCHEPALLETGGGLVNALPLLGDGAFFSANSDAFWRDGPVPALARLCAAWDPERMDALLLLVPPRQAVGYSGRGDFVLRGNGQLARSSAADLIFTGLQILHPRLFAGRAPEPFSLRVLYEAAQQPDGALQRMFGLLHDADWVHVGTPKELAAAEAYLAAQARNDR